MYKVVDTLNKVPIHICFDLETVEKTVKDLNERYGCICNYVEERQNYYVFDPGGSIFVDDVMFRFKICDFPSANVEVRSQHWEFFKHCLNKANSQKNQDRGVFKLYGYIFILSLKESHYSQLVSKIDQKKEYYDKISEQTTKHIEETWRTYREGDVK